MKPKIPPPNRMNAPIFIVTNPDVINPKLKGIIPGISSVPKNGWTYGIKFGGMLKYPAITTHPNMSGINEPIITHALFFAPINRKSHETKKKRKRPPKM